MPGIRASSQILFGTLDVIPSLGQRLDLNVGFPNPNPVVCTLNQSDFLLFCYLYNTNNSVHSTFLPNNNSHVYIPFYESNIDTTFLFYIITNGEMCPQLIHNHAPECVKGPGRDLKRESIP